MKTQTWTLGKATITRIEEQVGPNDSAAGGFIPDIVRERFEKHYAWMVPTHYDPARDRLITSCHSWLVRSGGRTILVDTCGGNHKERPWLPRFHMQDGPYLERLAAAGVTPADIDIVLCTHLHADRRRAEGACCRRVARLRSRDGAGDERAHGGRVQRDRGPAARALGVQDRL